MFIEDVAVENHRFFWGFSTSLDFYRLIYFVEKVMGQKADVYEVVDEKIIEPFSFDAEVQFAAFEMEDGNYYLLKNRNIQHLHFPKAKKADFIFIKETELDQNLNESLKDQLQAIVSVQSIFVVDRRFLSKKKLQYFAQSHF